MTFRTLFLAFLTAIAAPGSAAQTPAPQVPPDAQVERAIINAFRIASAVANVTRVAESLAASMDSLTARGTDTVLLIPTENGFRLAPLTDEPLAETAALLTHDAQGWLLRTLSPGDVPSEMAARPVRPWLSSPRSQARPAESPSVPSVIFNISGEVEGDAAPFVELSEATALRSLSAEADADRTQVEASFRFGSISEWAEWRTRPEIRDLMDRLENARMRLDATPR